MKNLTIRGGTIMQRVENLSEVGKRISHIRQSHHHSLEVFADTLNCEPDLLSQWEAGKQKPNSLMLNKLFKLGNTSLDELLYGPESLIEDLKVEIKQIISNFLSKINDPEGFYGGFFMFEEELLMEVFLRMPRSTYHAHEEHLLENALVNYHYSVSILDKENIYTLGDWKKWNNDFLAWMSELESEVLKDYMISIDSDITQAMRTLEMLEAPFEMDHKFARTFTQENNRFDVTEGFFSTINEHTSKCRDNIAKELIKRGNVVKVNYYLHDQNGIDHTTDKIYKTEYYNDRGEITQTIINHKNTFENLFR